MTGQRERAINAPWPVTLLIAILLCAFMVQRHFGVDAVAGRWGFAPRDLAEGRYQTVFTALFLHGNWPHVLANSVFALAFATPVARRLGEDAAGATAFFVFYLVCGTVGNLGYAAFNPGGADPVIGASGAIAGMMGAASRLLGRWDGTLAPFVSRSVIGLAAAWLLINLVFGVLFIGWSPGSGGAPIAWQAHLAGYAAGLFLFSPVLALLGRRGCDHAMGS